MGHFSMEKPPNPGSVLGGNQQTGAPGRIRTRDPLITNQVLYQLSYKGNAAAIAYLADE